MSYNARIRLAMPRVKMKELERSKVKGVETIQVLYEDDGLLVVHKPPWYMVHPSSEAPRAKDVLTTLNRPMLAPIHRLDRQTSGILVFSKSPELTREIQKIWSSPQIQKSYLAYVYGNPPGEFESHRELTDAKNGVKKSAQTSFKTLQYFSKGALVEAKITTGRRHQIRRHLSHLGFHILGDSMYGKGRINQWARDNGLSRLFLHAHHLILWHPLLKKSLTIECPLPEDLSSFLSQR